jgi:hypothetical protein
MKTRSMETFNAAEWLLRVWVVRKHRFETSTLFSCVVIKSSTPGGTQQCRHGGGCSTVLTFCLTILTDLNPGVSNIFMGKLAFTMVQLDP